MKSRIVALGAGFGTALFVSLFAAVLGLLVYRHFAGEDRSQPFVPEELAIWIAGSAVGAFAGAYVARRLSAGVTAVTAAIFGMATAAVNGIYFMAEPMPAAFWLGGALASIAGAFAGAAVARSRRAQITAPERIDPQPTLAEMPPPPSGDEWLGSPGRSFLARTGQSGRMRAGNAMLMAGGVLILYGNLKSPVDVVSILSGTALSACGFAWLCLAIRCPRCGVRVVWRTLSTVSHRHALFQAQEQEACPKCGYAPP